MAARDADCWLKLALCEPSRHICSPGLLVRRPDSARTIARLALKGARGLAALVKSAPVQQQQEQQQGQSGTMQPAGADGSAEGRVQRAELPQKPAPIPPATIVAAPSPPEDLPDPGCAKLRPWMGRAPATPRAQFTPSAVSLAECHKLSRAFHADMRTSSPCLQAGCTLLAIYHVTGLFTAAASALSSLVCHRLRTCQPLDHGGPANLHVLCCRRPSQQGSSSCYSCRTALAS